MNYNYWIIIAILKIFVTVGAVLLQKYYKFDGNYYPIMTTIIAAIYFIIYLFIFEDIKKLKKQNYLILILAGFLLFLYLLLNYNLIVKSSHPGYFKILAIYELIFILGISYYFFNAKITLKNWIGFIFIIIGTTFIIN